ncbi:MAG: DUF1724 domain-containing protein [Methanobacteriaceae archaeon]|nr:DUF1724 domain-containing protein [Methanobacteriaceae archaeon]
MFRNDDDFEELRFILNSKIRSKLLMCLFYHEDNLDNLRIILDKPSSTVLHTLHELTVLNLVDKRGKTFYLTSRGHIFVLVMYKFLTNLYFIKQNRDFLSTHAIDSIPDSCLKDLYLLINGRYIESEESDLSKPLNAYLNYIKFSNELNIILPIFSKIHIDAILKLVSKGNCDRLNIITSPSILKSLKKFGYIRKLKRLPSVIDFSLWKSNDEFEIFLTFSKDFTTMNLFFVDGHFDNSILFVDESDSGVKWSKNLFNYYLENSSKII